MSWRTRRNDCCPRSHLDQMAEASIIADEENAVVVDGELVVTPDAAGISVPSAELA